MVPGPPLLHHLEHVHIASDRNLRDARLPVQWVVRPGTDEHHDYRGFAGQIAGGVWRPGDEVLVLPSGGRSRIAAIDTFDGAVQEAFAPMSVTVRLCDALDVSRGDVLCRPDNRPTVSRDIDAMVCWMGERPGAEGARYLVKQATRTAPAQLRQLLYRVDVETLHRDRSVSAPALNDIGRVRLRTNRPLVFDSYARNRATGSFILVDEATNDTVAAGMVLAAAPAPALEPTALGTRTANVRWQGHALTPDERARALGHRGATIWITGLPASGKSTLAGGLERALVERAAPALRLDGDNLRQPNPSAGSPRRHAGRRERLQPRPVRCRRRSRRPRFGSPRRAPRPCRPAGWTHIAAGRRARRRCRSAGGRPAASRRWCSSPGRSPIRRPIRR